MAINFHVVTALFIHLLPHIVYPKALEYAILAFRRIERSEVEGQNSAMFQKCCSSDLPLSIPLNTRTLAYKKPCSPQASTNYATNYFPLYAAQVRTIDEIIPLHAMTPFVWLYHAEPYKQYDRVFIEISVLSIFKHYRACDKLPRLHCGSFKISTEPNWSNIRG